MFLKISKKRYSLSHITDTLWNAIILYIKTSILQIAILTYFESISESNHSVSQGRYRSRDIFVLWRSRLQTFQITRSLLYVNLVWNGLNFQVQLKIATPNNFNVQRKFSYNLLVFLGISYSLGRKTRMYIPIFFSA